MLHVSLCMVISIPSGLSRNTSHKTNTLGEYACPSLPPPDPLPQYSATTISLTTSHKHTEDLVQLHSQSMQLCRTTIFYGPWSHAYHTVYLFNDSTTQLGRDEVNIAENNIYNPLLLPEKVFVPFGKKRRSFGSSQENETEL